MAIAFAALFAAPALAQLASSSTPAAGQAVSEDVRFATGLRQRRLFSLVESFCRSRLDSTSLSPAARAELMIELLRSYAQEALNSTPRQRPQIWTKAAQAADDFKRRYMSNPRLFLIEFQQGRGMLSQGRLARQEAEVGANVEEAMTAARGQTRAAIRQFETLLAKVTQAIPSRRNARLNADDLTADELFALQNDVRLQLGRAYENQALCYPLQSDDRLAALTIALEHLAEPVKQLPSGEPLLDDVRLQQARCLRLRGDAAQAERLLGAMLANADVSQPRKNKAAAELARIRLMQRRTNEATKILAAVSQDDPEVQYARLETLAATILGAGQDQRADAKRKQAIALVSDIEDQHGPYWGRRANQLLVRVAGDAEGGAGLEILRRTAENLYLKGQLNEALAAYDKAAERAASIGNVEAAFRNRLTAALIEQKRDNLKGYLARMRSAALEFAGYEKASGAHMAAIMAAIKIARAEPAELKQYEALLAEHVDRWPTEDTADQARMWIGKMWAARRNWTEAIRAYSAITPQSGHFGSAVRAIAPCWQANLSELQLSKNATQDAAGRACIYFETLVIDKDGRFPETWSELDRIAILNAAQIRILYRQGDFLRAERLLKAGLQSSEDDPVWTRAARAWLVVALAGQGRAQEADQWISSLAQAKPEDLYQVVMQLDHITKTSKQLAAKSLTAVQRNALRLLSPSVAQLAPEQQLNVALIQGRTLLQAGQAGEAQSILAKLAKAHPRHGTVQESYAEALSAQPQTAEQALSQWRIVASRSPKESPRWYRAKYQVALTLYQQGKKKDAANRIRYLQQTSKMQTPLKPRFEDLLRKSQNE